MADETQQAAGPQIKATAPKRPTPRPFDELPDNLKTRAREELPLATHSLIPAKGQR